MTDFAAAMDNLSINETVEIGHEEGNASLDLLLSLGINHATYRHAAAFTVDEQQKVSC